MSSDASTAEPRARARRAIDYARFDATNAHEASFSRSRLCAALRDDPALDSMARHKRLKKEITEAHAALAQVRRALRGHGDLGGGERLTFVELCSGRGFLALVLGDAFPRARIRMIDNDTRMDISHVKAYSSVNTSFHALDLLSDECEEFIREAAASGGDGDLVVLVGVHLCGILSHRAIEIYERIPEVAALVVAPCCLPRRRRHDVFGYHCKDIAHSVGVDPHQCWATQLFFRLPLSSKRNMVVDHDMLSEHNTFLIARRPVEPALEALSISPRAGGAGCRVVAGRSRAKWLVVDRNS